MSNTWKDFDPLRHERMEEALRVIERMIDDEPIMEQPSQAQIDAMYPSEDD